MHSLLLLDRVSLGGSRIAVASNIASQVPTVPLTKTGDRPAQPLRLPGFEILGEIARGGMGIVYRARQVSLDRVVAIKCLPPTFANDPERLRRFRLEAKVAANLTDY